MKDDPTELEALFLRALELAPGARESFLSRISITHPEAEPELRSLLAAHDSDPEFLEDAAVSALFAEEARVGARVGPYEVVRELGRGGMGVVFLARRVEGGFSQDVAIKFARWGLSRGELGRVSAERAILARLKHPGIAHLYGGGVAGGRPYLVMEYVEGEPITDFAESRWLSVEARLDLLQDVCDAVQFAHRNLVIHRDLKPSNILVTSEGRVKLLDFGIAKLLRAVGEAPSDEATGTVRALTPAYSSPEQLRQLPITTSADVFALGSVAYEVLTGGPPFNVRGKSAAAVERMICEQEPPPPSRSTRAGPTKGRLDEDLDNIVLKALRKDPQERYESPRALADDFKRHLRGLPVIARSPTRRYRFAKYVRRNTAFVVSTAAVMLALVSGAVVATWQARVASQRASETAVALGDAQAATARTLRINGFLQSVFEAPNPSWYVEADAKGPDVTLLQALEGAAERMEVELADDPEVRADIHHTLGDTYRALGNFDGMVRHFEASLSLRRQTLEPPHPKIAEALYYQSTAVGLGGSWAVADSLLREGVSMQRLRDEGDNLPFMLAGLAGYPRLLGNQAESAAMLEEATALYVDRYGPDHEYYSSGTLSMAVLAGALVDLGDIDGAREWVGHSLEREDGPWGRWAKGLVRAHDGAFAEAEVLIRQALVASDRPEWRTSLARRVLMPTGRYQEAFDELTSAADSHAARLPGRPVAAQERLLPLALRAYVVALMEEDGQAEAEADAVSRELERGVPVDDLPYFWEIRLLIQATRGRVALSRGDISTAEAILVQNLETVRARSVGGEIFREVNADVISFYEAVGERVEGG